MIHSSSIFALWCLPFVLPICFFVAWSDMRAMRIPNKTVLLLVAVYAVVGFATLPLPEYGWGYAYLVIVLLVGMVMNMTGMVGAGDAKFAAAAAPFIHLGDLKFLIALFAANILAAFVTHRLTAKTPLTRLAPNWDSWERLWEFPMGLSLGGTLGLYLVLRALYGM